MALWDNIARSEDVPLTPSRLNFLKSTANTLQEAPPS
jgi:hypothetical protein